MAKLRNIDGKAATAAEPHSELRRAWPRVWYRFLALYSSAQQEQVEGFVLDWILDDGRDRGLAADKARVQRDRAITIQAANRLMGNKTAG
jgi:hypothetical protein